MRADNPARRSIGPQRIAKRMAMLAMPVVVAGCISVGIGGGGKPLPSLMSLTPATRAPAGQTLNSQTAQALVVLEPEVDHTLETTRVPVQVDENAISYLTGAAWIDQPRRLFQTLLIETIRARGKRLVLDENLPQVRISLSGRLDAMGYDARRQAVIVRFDALRVDRNGVTIARRFEAMQTGIAPVASAIAPALNVAANDVAGQIADWVDQ